MSKLLKISLALMLTTNLITPSIPSEVSVSAAQVSSSVAQSSSSPIFFSSAAGLSSSPTSSTKDTTKKKKKVKIVNNEIQEEDGIVLNKKDQERYDNCKKEVASKRAKRYKNKPTPCFKTVSTDKSDKQSEITPEDYNILWAGVAENKEILEKNVDPNVELPISEFINLNEAEIVSNNSSSSLSSLVTSSSTNSQSFSSSITSSSISSPVFSSSHSSTSSLKSSSYSSTQTFSLSSQASSSAPTTSWFSNIFNFDSIKAMAAANDGFKLPYENGVRAKLTQRLFNNVEMWEPGIHASHWDYSALDFVGEGQNYKIVASKPGKVVYSADTGMLGFGSHIVIQHADGSYALYGHLNLRKVAVGDNVSQAQYIGNEGSTGGQTSQHLHFETFNRYPCTVSNGVYNKVENCFETVNGAWKNYKGNAYYLASALAPKFDECTNNTKCRNGYPDVAWEFYTSQNKASTTPTPTTSKVLFRRKGTNQCLNIYNPRNDSVVNTWTCDTNDGDQKWEVVPVGTDGTKYNYKRVGTNQCLNALNPSNGVAIKTWTCDGSSEQQFNYDWGTQKLFRVKRLRCCFRKRWKAWPCRFSTRKI